MAARSGDGSGRGPGSAVGVRGGGVLLRPGVESPVQCPVAISAKALLRIERWDPLLNPGESRYPCEPPAMICRRSSYAAGVNTRRVSRMVTPACMKYSQPAIKKL